MVFHPPCTEYKLKSYAAYSHKEASCVAAFVIKTESPVVEKDGSDDGLTDVVSETHLSVWSNLYHPVFSRCTIVEKGCT